MTAPKKTTIKEQLEKYAAYIKSLPLEEIETKLAMAKALHNEEYVAMLEKIIMDIRK